MLTVLAGCSGAADDRAGPVREASGPSAPPSASAPSSAPPSASPSPVPTGTEPAYPPGPDGCHPNEGWDAEDEADWLDAVVVPPLYDGVFTEDGGVEVRGPDATWVGAPLCEPVRAQVQWWLVRGAGDSGFVRVEEVGRRALDLAMEEEAAVRPPESVSGRDPYCDGALLAVTAGGPLEEDDLPLRFEVLGDPIDHERVVYQKYTPPLNTSLCRD
ncbi:hypothetical protein [Streptomyces sp. DH37]|uniref:hypothetical protein n=1 Tax=Streptomyces sp. DH37 TaxID=3040122 RepID=UPI00244331FD|nr:hypothetical protein [Streptomyces sp. DH37]MDG9704188.1 hypothetical protein [Streptomyces sp. DH37]